MKTITIYLLAITISFFSCNSNSQNKPLAEIPFEISEQNKMQITLKINDQEIDNIIFDTGASISTLDKKIVSILGLELQENKFNVTGGNSSSEIRRTKAHKVYIHENLVLKSVKSNVFDLTAINSNGIIGFDILKKYITKIDFDTQKISFYKKNKLPSDISEYDKLNTSGSIEIPETDISFTLKNGERFNGKILFDTGNSASPLIINSPFERDNDLIKKIDKTLSIETKGIVSNSKNQYAAIKSLQIGNYKLNDLPIIISNAKTGVLSRQNYLGILGIEVISKFNVIVDFNRENIYIKPNKSYKQGFKFPLSGIRLKVENEEIHISSVLKPSMAYDKGLQKGQKLIAVNGIKGKDKSYYENLLQQSGKEVSIAVKLESGELKTVTITLERLI